MLLLKLSLLLLTSGFVVAQENGQNPNDDITKIFDPSIVDGYQRRYTIDVANKAEDCFFLENIQEGQTFHFHFMVTNVGRNGEKLDIVARIKSPSGKMLSYMSRKTEGKLIGQTITEEGNYEICFNNRYSMFERKRVMWQFEIEGAEDEIRQQEQEIKTNMKEYDEATVQTRRALLKTRGKVSRMTSSQWRVKTSMEKDIKRAEAIADMIDRWSIIHIFVLVATCIAQVYMLKRLFNVKPIRHDMKARP